MHWAWTPIWFSLSFSTRDFFIFASSTPDLLFYEFLFPIASRVIHSLYPSLVFVNWFVHSYTRGIYIYMYLYFITLRPALWLISLVFNVRLILCFFVHCFSFCLDECSAMFQFFCSLFPTHFILEGKQQSMIHLHENMKIELVCANSLSPDSSHFTFIHVDLAKKKTHSHNRNEFSQWNIKHNYSKHKLLQENVVNNYTILFHLLCAEVAMFQFGCYNYRLNSIIDETGWISWVIHAYEPTIWRKLSEKLPRKLTIHTEWQWTFVLLRKG